ncbi:MAG: putative toxin-antitoxin system toxin component, PIN family [Acidobacteriota bacterium]
MRVVFDTNVVVAGIVSAGLCHEILAVHVPEHTPILSPVLWEELIETLGNKFGLVPLALPIVGLYRQRAEWCSPEALDVPVCRDPDDDWVLATARTGRAEVIVTGDLDLLKMAAFEGITIESPRDFVGRRRRRLR